MCGEHKLTTLAREHDLDCLGRSNPGEVDGERFDGCWATERRTWVGRKRRRLTERLIRSFHVFSLCRP